MDLSFEGKFVRQMFISSNPVLGFFSPKASKNTSDIMDLIKVSILVFWSFVPVATYSFFGDMIETQFEMVYFELCQCKWYLFPDDLKQILLISMVNTKRPSQIRGYGKTFCSREAFKKVRRFVWFFFFLGKSESFLK